jgi:cytochrome c553
MVERLPVALLLLGAACLLPPGGFARSANANAGKAKAQTCSVCHGPLGVSVAPDAPNLAGQPEVYLSTQLRAYRSGERRHEVMTLVAKPLSDDDIANLSAWFSSVRIEARAPN